MVVSIQPHPALQPFLGSSWEPKACGEQQLASTFSECFCKVDTGLAPVQELKCTNCKNHCPHLEVLGTLPYTPRTALPEALLATEGWALPHKLWKSFATADTLSDLVIFGWLAASNNQHYSLSWSDLGDLQAQSEQ